MTPREHDAQLARVQASLSPFIREVYRTRVGDGYRTREGSQIITERVTPRLVPGTPRTV